jgi:hypothetical protein
MDIDHFLIADITEHAWAKAPADNGRTDRGTNIIVTATLRILLDYMYYNRNTTEL